MSEAPVTPILDLSKLPGNEHWSAFYIQHALCQMNFVCDAIEAGITLFDRSDEALAKTDKEKETRYLTHCKMIALRDGAISIYNFYKFMQSIDDNINTNPQLRSTIKIDEKRMAKKLFESYFPFCEELRHGVAHMGEFYSTSDDLASHGGGSINNMIDRTYSTSVNGKKVSYILSQQTHANLLRA